MPDLDKNALDRWITGNYGEDQLDCGHEPIPVSAGTGYATMNGQTYCYPCADDWAREDMRNHDSVFAYVSIDGKEITTWTGGRLAKVTNHKAEMRYTPTGGEFVRHYYRARAEGNDWFGIGPGPSMYVRMRRAKSK